MLLAQHGRASLGTAPQRRGPPPIPVVAAQARRGDIGVYFTGLGAVTPLYTVTVRSRVDGQLMNVFYSEGQMVNRGDLLAEIDPRPFQVKVTQAEGQMAKDQAALSNARTDLAATQESTVAQDEAAVKSDQGQVDSAKLNITYCHITAPRSIPPIPHPHAGAHLEDFAPHYRRGSGRHEARPQDLPVAGGSGTRRMTASVLPIEALGGGWDTSQLPSSHDLRQAR